MKQNEEPEYVKLYLKDLMYFNEIPQSHRSVLHKLLTISEYNEHEKAMKVYLNAGRKREISAELDIKVHTIQNVLTELCKGKLLLRKDTGIYFFNPYFFGHGLGHWSDINKYRSEIDYSEISGTTYKVNLDKKKELEHETERRT